MTCQWGEDEDDKKWQWNWAWRWDENYLTGTQDGERTKKEGGTKRKHQHQHTLPGAGEPWKGKRKEKAEADGRKPRPAEGGGGRTRLNQPNPSENRDLPRPGEHAWNRGTNGDLVDEKQNQKTGIQSPPRKVARCSHYRTVVGQPELGIEQLSSLHELGAQLIYLTRNTKKTIPAGKGHAWCLFACCCAVTVTWASIEERRFWCGCTLRKSKKELKPGTAAHSSTLRPTVWNTKKGRLFPFA